MDSPEKPPIGLMPKYVWQQKVQHERLLDVLNAVLRYSLAGKTIPEEWLAELGTLLPGVEIPTFNTKES
jgi:hypothetical protein